MTGSGSVIIQHCGRHFTILTDIFLCFIFTNMKLKKIYNETTRISQFNKKIYKNTSSVYIK